jgi:hypothetical protein
MNDPETCAFQAAGWARWFEFGGSLAQAHGVPGTPAGCRIAMRDSFIQDAGRLTGEASAWAQAAKLSDVLRAVEYKFPMWLRNGPTPGATRVAFALCEGSRHAALPRTTERLFQILNEADSRERLVEDVGPFLLLTKGGKK